MRLLVLALMYGWFAHMMLLGYNSLSENKISYSEAFGYLSMAIFTVSLTTALVIF